MFIAGTVEQFEEFVAGFIFPYHVEWAREHPGSIPVSLIGFCRVPKPIYLAMQNPIVFRSQVSKKPGDKRVSESLSCNGFINPSIYY